MDYLELLDDLYDEVEYDVDDVDISVLQELRGTVDGNAHWAEVVMAMDDRDPIDSVSGM
jgi:hypothetical protein